MGDLALLPDYVPEIIREDFRNPANDPYLVMLEETRVALVHVSAKFKPWELEAIKMHRNLVPVKEICKALKKSKPTVVSLFSFNKTLPSLLELMRNYEALVEGPTEGQRTAMLWSIARLNEKLEPKIAILAVTEMNRMKIAKERLKLDMGGTPNIVININQDQMPRTVLDA